MSKIKSAQGWDKELYHLIIEGDITFQAAIILIQKQAIEATLELAAKKVEVEYIYEDYCEDHIPYMGACGNCGEYNNKKILVGFKVDKQSILNLKHSEELKL